MNKLTVFMELNGAENSRKKVSRFLYSRGTFLNSNINFYSA